MSRLDILFNSELPSRAVTVYLVLNEYADKDGYCFPSSSNGESNPTA